MPNFINQSRMIDRRLIVHEYTTDMVRLRNEPQDIVALAGGNGGNPHCGSYLPVLTAKRSCGHRCVGHVCRLRL